MKKSTATKRKARKPAPKKAVRKSRAVSGKTGMRERVQSVRWSLRKASREFGVHWENLERARHALNIPPAEDRLFSTKQICAMAFGDKHTEEVRQKRADANAAERRDQRQAGELIPTQVATSLVEPIMVVVRQKICASSLTDSEKDDMLADLERAKDIDWVKVAKEAAK